MKLYYSPGACSLAPHIVAREAGIPLDLEKVDLGAHKLADGSNYYDVNPRGYVPAIRVKADEPVLTEANVVVQFLADQKPDSNLMPKAGTPERYRAQQWLAFVATELHKNFSWLWYKETAAETKTVSVSVDGVAVAQTASVTFKAGAADQTRSARAGGRASQLLSCR